jgi:hypothetical protein
MEPYIIITITSTSDNNLSKPQSFTRTLAEICTLLLDG